MKYAQLKNILDAMTPEQLDQPAVVFEGDAEVGNEIESTEESQEDFYWMDGECYGDLKTTEEQIAQMKEGGDSEISIEDFTKVPKGTVTLHYSLD